MDHQTLIANIFQQYLGRAPSDAEMQGFTQAMQNGILDPIGMINFIQSTAQYQQAQIPQNAQAIGSNLQTQLDKSTDTTLKQGMDAATAQFAKQGRPSSTGLSAQYAQVAGNVAAQNSQKVAGAVGGYLTGAYGGLTGTQQGNNANYSQGFQGYQNFANSKELNNTQNQYYQNYLNQNLKQAQQNNWFQLGGSLISGGSKVAAAQ